MRAKAPLNHLTLPHGIKRRRLNAIFDLKDLGSHRRRKASDCFAACFKPFTSRPQAGPQSGPQACHVCAVGQFARRNAHCRPQRLGLQAKPRIRPSKFWGRHLKGKHAVAVGLSWRRARLTMFVSAVSLYRSELATCKQASQQTRAMRPVRCWCQICGIKPVVKRLAARASCKARMSLTQIQHKTAVTGAHVRMRHKPLPVLDRTGDTSNASVLSVSGCPENMMQLPQKGSFSNVTTAKRHSCLQVRGLPGLLPRYVKP